ncbi:MAG: imidazolonepropionase, partial [Alistipes sp.]|nr:imidazolonepropionase [Alistipes sp.]
MLLIKNIAKIVGVDESGRLRVKGADMNTLGEIDNAWLLADGDRIADYGPMETMPRIAPGT